VRGESVPLTMPRMGLKSDGSGKQGEGFLPPLRRIFFQVRDLENAGSTNAPDLKPPRRHCDLMFPIGLA